MAAAWASVSSLTSVVSSSGSVSSRTSTEIAVAKPFSRYEAILSLEKDVESCSKLSTWFSSKDEAELYAKALFRLISETVPRRSKEWRYSEACNRHRYFYDLPMVRVFSDGHVGLPRKICRFDISSLTTEYFGTKEYVLISGRD